MQETETHIKDRIKDFLNAYGLFNYPLLQGIGSYKGVPDRIFHLFCRPYYLEIKKPGGELSKYQLLFKAQCERDGVPYWVVEDEIQLADLLRQEGFTRV